MLYQTYRTAKSLFLIVRYLKLCGIQFNQANGCCEIQINTPLGNGLCDFFTPITQLVIVCR